MTEQAPVVLEAPRPDKATGAVRLNLGGRDKPIKGFLTVDLFEGPGVDVRTDITKLDMFKDGEVEEIYASHCLEHTPHPKTVSVLKEWRRVLKKGGKAYIAVPDFQAVVNLYLKQGFNDWIRNFLWGDQIYDLAFHYAGFDYSYLARQLVEAGFLDVRRLASMPYGVNDCSHLVDSHYRTPVSLNVEAIA